MARRLVVTSKYAVLPGATCLVPATIEITQGSISAVHAYHTVLSAHPEYSTLNKSEFIDLGELWLLPGLVDSHVHLNEPGRTEWEGFATGTNAAASGGVTLVCDMPLNAIPPTTTLENFDIKKRAAEGQCRVDVAFWGGLVPDNSDHLIPLVENGVKGFKCFMIDSGVLDFPCVNEEEIVRGLEQLKKVKSKTQLLYHAELDTTMPSPSLDAPPRSYATFLNSRPESLEVTAIQLIAKLQLAYPTIPMHIVHLSAASALDVIRDVRRKGMPLSVETTFHYLCLASEDVQEGRTDYKCCPPIRNKANRDLLWEALIAGDIDIAISDHSPCVAELKKLDSGDFNTSWGGVSGLGLGLSLMFTEGSKRGVGMNQLMGWMASGPAKQLGLQDTKGSLKVGADGDFVVFDPKAEFTVGKKHMIFKNKVTPYEGLKLTGQVERTYLRGQLIYEKGEFDIVSLLSQSTDLRLLLMYHDGMNHDHVAMDMDSCSMNMLWNSDVKNVCVVFKSFRIRGYPSLLFAMACLFLLSVAYERLRQMITQREAQIKRLHLSDVDPRTGKRKPNPNNASQPTCKCSTNGESQALLKCTCSNSATIHLNPDGVSVRLSLAEQAERSAYYTLMITVSFFIMLVIMTYNTWLISAVLGGAFAGHMLYQRDLQLSLTEEQEDRGMACH